MSKLLTKMMDEHTDSELELCVLWVADDAEKWDAGDKPYEHASKGAEELYALYERLEKLEAFAMETRDYLHKEIESVGGVGCEKELGMIETVDAYFSKYEVEA